MHSRDDDGSKGVAEDLITPLTSSPIQTCHFLKISKRQHWDIGSDGAGAGGPGPEGPPELPNDTAQMYPLRDRYG
jgi:hypothetical protein